MTNRTGKPDAFVLPRSRLDDLVRWLLAHGYEVIGPTLQGGQLGIDCIQSASDLPAGFSDRQTPSRYRLVPRADAAVFAHAVGQSSYKRLFLTPEQRLITVRRGKECWSVSAATPAAQRTALLGARSCDLAAIAIQDRALGRGPLLDPHYVARRKDVLVIGVDCTQPGGTCFCASMGTGPDVVDGFDLALTELLEPEHRFVVRTGSEIGGTIVGELGLEPAAALDVEQARAAVSEAGKEMQRSLDVRGLRERLLERTDHPRWDDVALRCLSCAMCTTVCPTCFCTSVEDAIEPTGATAARIRRWDSCFGLVPDETAGEVSMRSTVRARYQRWLTHKLAAWWDQFGTSGCVGCGRCITWCPAGIDITQESAAIAGPDAVA